MDNLLRLIENNELETILSDSEMHPKLNELIKYELVIIKGDVVTLSEKGQEGKIIGVENILNKMKNKNASQKKVFRYNIINLNQRKKDIGLLVLLIMVIIFTFLYFFLRLINIYSPYF